MDLDAYSTLLVLFGKRRNFSSAIPAARVNTRDVRVASAREFSRISRDSVRETNRTRPRLCRVYIREKREYFNYLCNLQVQLCFHQPVERGLTRIIINVVHRTLFFPFSLCSSTLISFHKRRPIKAPIILRGGANYFPTTERPARTPV